MKSVLGLLLVVVSFISVECNSEGDILDAWKSQLSDPNGVLQSWDPTLVNPCTWFHVTCNLQNIVVRLDLGNANLSGHLIPQLGGLSELQYLELYGNSLSGVIPVELGKLKNLISLDLYQNEFTGTIPASLGNLKKLGYLRLNSNKLTGLVPAEVFQLVALGNLRILNVSDNLFVGTLRHNGHKPRKVSTIVIQDARA